jgi:hypothetical protein
VFSPSRFELSRWLLWDVNFLVRRLRKKT